MGAAFGVTFIGTAAGAVGVIAALGPIGPTIAAIIIVYSAFFERGQC